MSKMVEKEFPVNLPGSGVMTCDVEIFVKKDFDLVIVTERPDNPGMSITNSAEHLASAVVTAFALDPDHLIWVEHYPHLDGAFPASWDGCNFTWRGLNAKNPKWYFLDVCPDPEDDLAHMTSSSKKLVKDVVEEMMSEIDVDIDVTS